ncbi:MAG: WbqC family protein, partial [Pseudomonadota bacterium]
PSSSLVDICMHFLDRIRMILEIDTPLVCSSELLEDGSVDSLNPTERLVYLCQRMHCDRYLSGPAARDYLEQKRFHEAGIEVEWFAYPEYPEYDQPHPPFEHAVSAFDLLLCKGAEARAFISR